MPAITLPDGSVRQYDDNVTVQQIAESIGPGLAQATVGGSVNGEDVDTHYTVSQDSEVTLYTERSEEGLEIIRHSAAHLLAQAVKELFPQAQVTIGPVIDNGFYYDFAYERAFTTDDLEKIEARMQEIVKSNQSVSRRTLSRDEAVAHFRDQGENYKAEIIEDIPKDETLSLYKQGDFEDLCRGPHVPSTGKLKYFKLMKVAGAYWRGDSNNEMLQRIYGTAWSTKKELKQYLRQLEEAEKRDHRKLAKKYDLFHTQEEAPGMVFWHPNGWAIYSAIESYMRGVQRRNGYQEIKTPQIVDRSLWEKSGHWSKFKEGMFLVESEDRDFAIKPMNCPCHVQVFNQGIKSYRDLPLRLAEFGSCHRNEPSGTLQGIMRVRAFTQDDGHIFCSEGSIQEEVSQFTDLLFKVYKDFGFEDILIRLSTRPEKRVGADEIWDKSEKALADALNAKGFDWKELPGEGAFYGPKIEFSLKDCIGRVWQCGTIQVDFSMPERLNAQFVAEDGSRQTPVMLHRAVLGSFERFIGILIENYEGAFPAWLAPVQVAIANITDAQAEYAQSVVDILENNGFRAKCDLRNEKIGFKIREHAIQRIPYVLVVGDKERENKAVSVRTRGGEDLGSMPIDQFVSLLGQQIAMKVPEHTSITDSP